MDNSVVKVIGREKNVDIPDFGRNFSVPLDMGANSIQRKRLFGIHKQSAARFLAIYFAFMFDIFNINTNTQKMAFKGGIIIVAWLAGFVGFGYTLLTVNWDDIKAVVLLVIATLWSFVNLIRACIKMWKEYHEAKHHIRNLKK